MAANFLLRIGLTPWRAPLAGKRVGVRAVAGGLAPTKSAAGCSSAIPTYVGTARCDCQRPRRAVDFNDVGPLVEE